ncbi:DUF2218 domain-containing protein [Wenxinia saemankumensis]|uniref:2,4-dihydroxyhept-2-ene-1,7-dioic acid aldolase n=1 Tax=Wenxinia saemankumensis TaxID=1447782 RepID=A0A1M6ACG2_9RHOB|nr:DUF2218 domain-containing protein [Wenxinia saemankumensis]SHI34099.1 hypothetical protein SAMN05444417_0356 [Wenxinia saemankumensis]
MQPPFAATGTFPTGKASQYLQQLCKHFAHKIEVRYDPTSAEAALPTGPCIMAAGDDLLTIGVTAPDAEGLARAKAIVDDHLARFAHREDFTTMDWTDHPAG